MKESLKNKNLLVIIFEIIIIILGIIGITFATQKILNDRTTTNLTAGEYGLDYKGDKSVNIKDIEPIDDNLVNIDTVDNVIRLEFGVRGVSTNNNDKLIYDVMLDKMNIDCALLNKYTKWRLYKNGNLLSSGSLDPAFDGNVLTKNMRLTDIQESLPKYNQEYDNYVLLFWISESCDNLETCELVDQSSIANSKMDMEVFIAVYSGTKKKLERIPNYDNSCANKPELYDNMIPVTYRNGEWVVADSNNNSKDNLWYNYADNKWANAVVVSNKANKTIGTVIDNKDVLGYYVWIPRFRYKLWNVEDGQEGYNAYDNGIDIIFENGLGSITNEIVNNNYITHPVFKDNLRGFWVSKYEISKDNDNYRFIPNVESYHNDTVDNYNKIIDGLNNYYNLNNANIHMINNLEWGAVTYLSHSKYGVCAGDGCDNIGVNDTYISANNKQDTTTRNVYGVYDMAGASGEYVLGKPEIGTAMSEVINSNGSAWGNVNSIISGRDYVIRGGTNKNIFYFGDMSMDPIENSTRSSIVSK